VIDTSAAFFEGDQENDNHQMGQHARMMRSLVELEGGPAVVVTCHPTKTPNMDALYPRGGGAFLAEVDGNLVAIKEDDVVKVHWQGKFRGSDFSEIPFRLKRGTSPKLVDSKGRQLSTVTAEPITSAQQQVLEDQHDVRCANVLSVMKAESGVSIAGIAQQLDWLYSDGAPNKTAVQRCIDTLNKRGQVKKTDGRWVKERP
jgi:hypothetical protein